MSGGIIYIQFTPETEKNTAQMAHYRILEIPENASRDEIKRLTGDFPRYTTQMLLPEIKPLLKKR